MLHFVGVSGDQTSELGERGPIVSPYNRPSATVCLFQASNSSTPHNDAFTHRFRWTSFFSEHSSIERSHRIDRRLKLFRLGRRAFTRLHDDKSRTTRLQNYTIWRQWRKLMLIGNEESTKEVDSRPWNCRYLMENYRPIDKLDKSTSLKTIVDSYV